MDATLPFRVTRMAEEPALKVLIVRVGAMGDVLHGLPAVAALRRRLPHCFIGWAVEPRWQDLLVGDADRVLVDRIHAVPTREWKRRPVSISTLRQIVALRREMMAERYDVCVDLQGAIRSAVIGRMAAAKNFLGPARPRERLARALYRDRVELRAGNVIEQACELVQGALSGIRDPAETLWPARVELPVTSAAESWCDVRLAEQRVRPAGFVLLSPAAGWGAKQWPVERYRALAKTLQEAGYTVLVNAGGAADRAVSDAVAGGDAGTVVDCSVAELIALTRRARLVVGGDTGPIHLAAALGRPVVALFGPTDPKRNGPFFPASRVRVLRHASSRLDHARHAETEAGLAKITEDEVLAAAFQLLHQAAVEMGAHG